jgi:hypothetical protein
MSLYQIEQDIELALEKYYSLFDEDWVQICTDEELETVQKELEEKQNKIDDLKSWILKKRANTLWNIQAIDLEIERLTKLKQNQEKQIIQSENFLKHLFWKIDKPFIFDNFKIWYSKSSSTVIENEDLIPKKFRVIEIVKTIKYPKAPIAKAIKEWKKVPWAIIQENLNFYIK